MARKMVCEWGMSEELGPLTYGKKEEAIFLGREFNRHQDYSENTALKIDAEVKRIVSAQYERARAIITEQKERLVAVAEALLEHEVLDALQIQQLLRGEKIPDRVRARPAAAEPPREPRAESEPSGIGNLLTPPVAHPKPSA